MGIFANHRATKNINHLLSVCSDLIKNYEDSRFPSCEKDLIDDIGRQLNAARDELSNWNNDEIDYIKVAHSMLANTTFDLLASGKYHVSAGVLNPMKCTSNLLSVYHKSMDYAVARFEITEEAKEEQYDYLKRCINEVG